MSFEQDSNRFKIWFDKSKGQKHTGRGTARCDAVRCGATISKPFMAVSITAAAGSRRCGAARWQAVWRDQIWNSWVCFFASDYPRLDATSTMGLLFRLFIGCKIIEEWFTLIFKGYNGYPLVYYYVPNFS